MNAPEHNPAADELLRHAQWIRSLARALISDDAAAEDVVQETMVAALTHSPANAKLRTWLRQVVRNFARQHHRSGGRRREREETVQGPSGLPGPAELSERLETEQRLTRELARLDEPFRSTLMHRFYDDLQPAEIARRLGIPGGTVRWRLKHGLEILRARLDDASDADRSAWSLALLPLARMENAAAVGAGVSSIALPGLILMNVLKVTAASAAVLVVAVGLAVTGVLPDSLVPWFMGDRPVNVSFQPLDEETVALRGTALTEFGQPDARVAVPVTAARESEAPPDDEGPDPVLFDARILGGGLPLASAQMVVVVLGIERQEPVLSAHDGSVSVAVPISRSMAAWGTGTPFPVSVAIHATGFASVEIETRGEAGSTTHLGPIDLAPGGAVSGVVLDENGRGLADCTITLAGPGQSRKRLDQQRFLPANITVPSTRTDSQGRFRLPGAPVGRVRLWGHADGYLSSYSAPIEIRAGQESSGVEFELEPLGPSNLVRGVVLAPNGTPIPHAKLQFRNWSNATRTSIEGSRETDVNGRFEFLMREDATLSLTASDPEGRWGKATVANVDAGNVDLVLQLSHELMLTLEVRAANREPVTRYGLEVLEQDGEHNLAVLPAAEHPAGRMEFARPTTTFIVRITAPGHERLELGPLDPTLLLDPYLTATLSPLPGLHGRVLRHGRPVAGVRVALHTQVEEHMLIHRDGFRLRMLTDAVDQARTDDEGRFLLTPRSAGGYFVRAAQESGVASEYGPFVVAGNLSGPEVELHLGVGGAIEGRVVLAGGVDSEGVVVAITRGDGSARTQRVGTDGVFRFDGLMVGPWRVERRTEELKIGQSSTTSGDTGGEQPFDDSSCNVVEGETTFFDLLEVPDERLPFTGRLTINGTPAEDWSAALVPSGTLAIGGGPTATLDIDGTFVLQAAASGRQRLILSSPPATRGEQFLTDEVDMSSGSWSHDLEVGVLIIEGLEQWGEEDVPRVVHYWKGPGDMACITMILPDENGTARIDRAPAGESRLVVPERDVLPEKWKVLRELQLEAGAEQTVDLR